MTASVLMILILLAGACTSTEGAEGGDVPLDPDATTLVIPTPTIPPLPSPTPAIPDSGVGNIIVGSLLAQSGIMVKREMPVILAVRLQVERLNQEGGLLNRPIELIEVDTESRLGVTAGAARDLISKGADVLLVSCDPVRASAAIEVALEFGVLALSPCGADESWATEDPLVFSFGTSSVHEGRVLAEWAIDNGISTTAALIDATNPDTEAFCTSFTLHFRSLGGVVAFSDRFTFDSLDPFEDRLAQRPTSVDSVLLCSHLPGGLNGAPNIIELVRNRGITAPILGSSGIDGGPSWFKIVAVELGRLVMVTPTSTHGDDPNPTVRELVDRLNLDQVAPPARGWSVFGADTIAGWAIAVERAQSVDGDDVAAELEQFNNEALLGSRITFGANRHMDADRELRIIDVTDNVASLLEVRSTR